jgi:hypothetical protein
MHAEDYLYFFVYVLPLACMQSLPLYIVFRCSVRLPVTLYVHTVSVRYINLRVAMPV